jgi:hypothetical protein
VGRGRARLGRLGRRVTTLRYDPALVEQLHLRTIAAVAALAAVRSTDPGAAHALRVAGRMRRHLEDDWLPLLESIGDSRAMVSWSTTVADGDLPAWLDGLVRWLRSTWRVTWRVTTGLEHLPTGELLRTLLDAGGDFERAATRGEGDAVTTWRRLQAHLAELARRIDDDPGAGALAWAALGGRGVTDLVGWQATAIERSRLGLLGVDGDAAIDRSTTSLAVVLAALAHHDPAAVDVLTRLSTSSVVVGEAIAATPERFDPTLVVAVASELLVSARALDVMIPDRAAQLRTATASAMRAVLALPVAALDRVLDEEVLCELATSAILAADDVEAIVTAALVVPLGDDARLTTGLSRLVALSRAAQDATLNDGARRGIALGIGPYLGPIATQLAARSADELIVIGGGGTLVDFGGREGFTGLVGQVVDDERAQLVLGVTIAGFRAERLAEATAAVEAPPRGTHHARRDALVAALSDVDRILDLVRSGIAHQDAQHAFQHALSVGRSKLVLDAATTALSVFGPTAPAARLGVAVGSKVVAAAVGGRAASRVPRTSLFEEQERDTKRAILSLPLERPELRSRLGVDGVATDTRAEVADLLDRMDRTDDPAEGDRLAALLLDTIAGDIRLAGYVAVVESLSDR